MPLKIGRRKGKGLHRTYLLQGVISFKRMKERSEGEDKEDEQGVGQRHGGIYSCIFT